MKLGNHNIVKLDNMLSRGLGGEWLIQQLGYESIVITRANYEGDIDPEWDKIPALKFD